MYELSEKFVLWQHMPWVFLLIYRHNILLIQRNCENNLEKRNIERIKNPLSWKCMWLVNTISSCYLLHFTHENRIEFRVFSRKFRETTADQTQRNDRLCDSMQHWTSAKWSQCVALIQQLQYILPYRWCTQYFILIIN